MTYVFEKTLRGFKPLVYIEDGVVGFARGAIVKLNSELNNEELLFILPSAGFLQKIFSKNKILRRIFRWDPICAIILDENLFVACKSKIWRFDLRKRELTLNFSIPGGRKLLNLSVINRSGDKKIIFGEYFSNFERSSVCIWELDSSLNEWIRRFEFPVGEIEHIHAVTQIEDEILILTGDFEDAAGIWLSDLYFKKVVPLARGSQAYRAAWIAKLKDRLYYATDSQLMENGIRCIDNYSVSDSIFFLEGSSIYSACNEKEIYFSTAVECGLPTGNLFKDLFDRKSGPSILSRHAKIYSLKISGDIEEIFSCVKDGWPMRLGQFGTFMFPSGEVPNNWMLAYGVAVKRYHDCCLLFRKI